MVWHVSLEGVDAVASATGDVLYTGENLPPHKNTVVKTGTFATLAVGVDDVKEHSVGVDTTADVSTGMGSKYYAKGSMVESTIVTNDLEVATALADAFSGTPLDSGRVVGVAANVDHMAVPGLAKWGYASHLGNGHVGIAPHLFTGTLNGVREYPLAKSAEEKDTHEPSFAWSPVVYKGINGPTGTPVGLEGTVGVGSSVV